MKARLQMIGDYDEESKTYAVLLLADENEVDFDEFHDGDEVEISKISNADEQCNRTVQYLREIGEYKMRWQTTLNIL